MSESLFVYGTLHPDRAPSEIADVVRQLEPIGKGSIRARFHRFREYPAIKLDPRARKKIDGDVFRIPDDASLKQLDEYEEYYPAAPLKSLFTRRLVNVRLADGSEIEAWVYEYAKPLPAAKKKTRTATARTRKAKASAAAA